MGALAEQLDYLPQSGRYSHDDRRRAVISYINHGNVADVARETKLPASTLYHWTTTAWWGTLVEELGDRVTELQERKLMRIVDRALDTLEDRLQHGDYIITKTGDIERVPIPARTATQILATAFDKLQILKGQPTEIVQTSDRLTELADKLRAFAGQSGLVLEHDAAAETENPPDDET